MAMPRWERHWWQTTEPVKTVDQEPTVWVDPDLYIEEQQQEHARPRRMAEGTVPPPACVGPYCDVDLDELRDTVVN